MWARTTQVRQDRLLLASHIFQRVRQDRKPIDVEMTAGQVAFVVSGLRQCNDSGGSPGRVADRFLKTSVHHTDPTADNDFRGVPLVRRLSSSFRNSMGGTQVEVQIVRAGIDHVGLIAPLLNSYRQFYGQTSDLDGAKAFLAERL